MKKDGVVFLLISLVISSFLVTQPANAQMITGVWKGKINQQKAEIKIIQNGDSLTGTSYYFENSNNYRRYSIKGYFDATTNEAVWWDDALLEEKSSRYSISSPGKIPLLSRADFNCPGNGKMMLDGKASAIENPDKPKGDVDLDKTTTSQFKDDWDFIIENYTAGTNDPEIIDSIQQIANRPPVIEEPVKAERPIVPIPSPAIEKNDQKIDPPNQELKQAVKIAEPAKPTGIVEKFTTRTKTFIKEIPVSGDSIELRFYDNAEIDGDSISLFLNDKLIFSHIRLTGNAYSIKIAVSELQERNELIMVAENLGTIPPNTSYMVAIVNNQRYDAYLASTEGSSAMIRFVKQSN